VLSPSRISLDLLFRPRHNSPPWEPSARLQVDSAALPSITYSFCLPARKYTRPNVRPQERAICLADCFEADLVRLDVTKQVGFHSLLAPIYLSRAITRTFLDLPATLAIPPLWGTRSRIISYDRITRWIWWDQMYVDIQIRSNLPDCCWKKKIYRVQIYRSKRLRYPGYPSYFTAVPMNDENEGHRGVTLACDCKRASRESKWRMRSRHCQCHRRAISTSEARQVEQRRI